MLKKFILIDLLDLCDLIKKTDTYLTLFYYVFSYAKFRPTYMYRVGLEQVSLRTFQNGQGADSKNSELVWRYIHVSANLCSLANLWFGWNESANLCQTTDWLVQSANLQTG